MDRTEQISRRIKLRHLICCGPSSSRGVCSRRPSISQCHSPLFQRLLPISSKRLGCACSNGDSAVLSPQSTGWHSSSCSIAIFDDLRTSIKELESLADPTAGELRIGSTEAMGTSLVPIVIDRMSRQYPRIRFEVVLADPETLQERELRGRKIDLVIGQRIMPGFDDRDLNVSIFIVIGCAS